MTTPLGPPHFCAWCSRPFNDYGELTVHGDAEHAEEIRSYAAMWENPTAENVASMIVSLVGAPMVRAAVSHFHGEDALRGQLYAVRLETIEDQCPT